MIGTATNASSNDRKGTYLRAIKTIELQHKQWYSFTDRLDHHQKPYEGHPHAPAHLGGVVHGHYFVFGRK